MWPLLITIQAQLWQLSIHFFFFAEKLTVHFNSCSNFNTLIQNFKGSSGNKVNILCYTLVEAMHCGEYCFYCISVTFLPLWNQWLTYPISSLWKARSLVSFWYCRATQQRNPSSLSSQPASTMLKFLDFPPNSIYYST